MPLLLLDFPMGGVAPASSVRFPSPFCSGCASGNPALRRGAGRTRAGQGPGWAASHSGAAPGSVSLYCPRQLWLGEPSASSTGTSVHGWTRPDTAGRGLAGGGPGGVSRGSAGPRPRAPEARGPTGPGDGTMMPGETHSAAPGTAADLSRCQGCASLQQVRRLLEPGAQRGSAGRPGREAGGRAARAGPPRAAPAPRRKPPSHPCSSSLFS